MKKNKRIKISENFIKAKICYQKNQSKSLEVLKNISMQQDNLFTIVFIFNIDQDLEKDNKIVLKLF